MSAVITDSITDVLLGYSKTVSLESFRLYLSTVEISVENLNFWEAIQKLKTMQTVQASQSELFSYAKMLWDTFLKRRAAQEINISNNTKTLIIKSLEADKFEFEGWFSAQAEVFKLMKTDSWKRFIEHESTRQRSDSLSGEKPCGRRSFSSNYPADTITSNSSSSFFPRKLSLATSNSTSERPHRESLSLTMSRTNSDTNTNVLSPRRSSITSVMSTKSDSYTTSTPDLKSSRKSSKSSISVNSDLDLNNNDNSSGRRQSGSGKKMKRVKKNTLKKQKSKSKEAASPSPEFKTSGFDSIFSNMQARTAKDDEEDTTQGLIDFFSQGARI